MHGLGLRSTTEFKVEVEVVAAQLKQKPKRALSNDRTGEGGSWDGGGGGGRPENPGKLFVGGLAWATDDFTLRAAFEEFGEVTDSVVLMDRDDPSRSRGFGFVTFASPEDAKMAADEMDGQMLDGRALRVNAADSPPPPRGGGGGRGGGRGGYRGGGGGGRRGGGGGGGYGGGGGGYGGGGGGYGGGGGRGGGGGGYEMGY